MKLKQIINFGSMSITRVLIIYTFLMILAFTAFQDKPKVNLLVVYSLLIISILYLLQREMDELKMELRKQ